MKRRTFLQLTGMITASAWLSGCRQGNERLIPYLVPPDEGVTPGRAEYYASSCRSCPAGCGILVRVSEGRAKKIEGNPLHPVNRGKLCARGQAALQELYHPDRVTRPLRRTGPRGSGKFTGISWEEGLSLLTSDLAGLLRHGTGDRLALITPELRGTLAELTAGFMRSFGSSRRLAFELLSPDWLSEANRRGYGLADLPWYDIAETRYLLSFGADFVESHLSPVQYGNAFGRMRQGRNTVRGHFTYVGGRMSLTGASADRWLPARPGSEGVLALGMARLILAESLFDRDALAANGVQAEQLLRRLDGYQLPRVAELTGLPRHVVAEVAREFAATRPSLAMAGESVAFQSNGRESVRAVQLLNLLAGNLNRPGGVYPSTGPVNGGAGSLAELLSLIGDMDSGRIRTALIYGNPVHSVPPATGFRQALRKVPFIISFSPILDDTALEADLVLPDHAALESWGDVVPLAGARREVVGLMQPVVAPLHDTRQFPEVLMAVARGLGGGPAAAFPYQSWPEMLKGSTARRMGLPADENFEGVWAGLLQRGGMFETGSGPTETYRPVFGPEPPQPAPPRFAGATGDYPLHLQVYPSTAFHDGRGAALPWLQQLPDPLTTVVWGSWVEINPRTAAGLGIRQGDLVEVTSPRGSLRVPAVIYPGIRPDMVAIPLGQGHRGMGRYAQGRGVNPLELVELLREGEEPLPAWNATRVRVTRVSGRGELVTAGHPEGSYRSDLVGI